MPCTLSFKTSLVFCFFHYAFSLSLTHTHSRTRLLLFKLCRMPNLGQGGCQAIEDAFVLSEELRGATKRSQVESVLRHYQSRRLIRSAAVQGLSRFASDIIIRGFDTPAKISKDEDGNIQFENFNYAGIVTRMLQPILPIFFMVQFNFLYSGWRNKSSVDLKATLGIGLIGGLIALSFAEVGVGIGLGIEAFIGEVLAAIGIGEEAVTEIEKLKDAVDIDSITDTLNNLNM